MMKKILCLTLAVLMILGTFAGCGETETPESTPAPTETAIVDYTQQDDGNLKILTLGHSLAVDAGHLLAPIAAAEGVNNLTIGTLYYSGCPLNRHVEFATGNKPEYKLYISNSASPSRPEIMDSVTMKDALRYQDWDIIVMQGGVFEIAKSDTYTNGNIQKIQEFVKANVMKKDFVFAWNMPWSPATEMLLKAKYPLEPNTYISNYEPYGNNRQTLFADITKCVGDHIVTDNTFKFLIPTGTAFENAMTSYLTEYDLHRDYVHASDLARIIITYTWLCKLKGIEKLDELKFTTLPKTYFNSKTEAVDYVLTESEINLILESVNNALANPLQITQSQYTEAPADYVAVLPS